MRLRTVALVVTLALGLLGLPPPADVQQAGKIHRIGNLFHGIAARDKSLLAAFK